MVREGRRITAPVSGCALAGAVNRARPIARRGSPGKTAAKSRSCTTLCRTEGVTGALYASHHVFPYTEVEGHGSAESSVYTPPVAVSVARSTGPPESRRLGRVTREGREGPPRAAPSARLTRSGLEGVKGADRGVAERALFVPVARGHSVDAFLRGRGGDLWGSGHGVSRGSAGRGWRGVLV